MLVASDCRVDFNRHCVFKNISFEVKPGELLHIQGANGAGKSTLLKALVGLIPLSYGQVQWQSQEIRKNAYEFHRALAYLGHKPAVKSSLTVRENLNNKFKDIMRLENISHKMVKDLSAGQKQRVALTRIFNSGAELWVLDEPMTCLDQDSIGVVARELSNHVKSGGMVILTSHHPVRLEQIPVKSLSLSDGGQS